MATARILFGLMVSLLLASASPAADWPTVLGNNQRNAFVEEKLDAQRFELDWTHDCGSVPTPAWYGPAKWDAYAELRDLRSMRDYDVVYQVTAVGDRFFYSSSTDDSVKCLDANTGKQLWQYTTDGPVRVAPSINKGRVYFGSDDGFAYCVKATDGSLIWKFRPSKPEHLFVYNGRFIPFWPVRTGVLIVDDTAYFGASLLPWKKSFLCAVDANTGKATGPGRYVQTLEKVTIEGPMACTDKLLLVPQGRVPPRVYARATGKELGSLKGGGGSFVVVTGDQVMHGPGNKAGWITSSNPDTQAQVASFKNGNAIVAVGNSTFMLTDNSIVASKFEPREMQWTVECDCPLTLIAVGDQLIAGGVDKVAAYSMRDGSQLWSHPVSGKAFGLTFAGGRLFVSTDEGKIHSFQQTGQASSPPATDSPPAEPAKEPAPPLAEIPDVEDDSLLDRWVFQRPALVNHRLKNLARDKPITISGPTKTAFANEHEWLELDGGSTSIMIEKDHTKAGLPAKTISVEAWVRIDQSLTWGGIAGAIQDNGSHERGWLLGYRGQKFCWAVAAKGKDGSKSENSKLTYMNAGKDFQLGRWYHVAGTYDGSTMRLFVDGKQVASSNEQSGEINYPKSTFFELAAYHDDNEHYQVKGAIHQVRIYKRAVSASELEQRSEASTTWFPEPLEQPESAPDSNDYRLASGPWVEYTSPSEAIVRWQTNDETSSFLTLRSEDTDEARDVGRINTPRRQHVAKLDDLKRNRTYYYSITTTESGEPTTTREFELDTFFNYSVTATKKTGQSPALADIPQPWSGNCSRE